jgi:hypothetical protein
MVLKQNRLIVLLTLVAAIIVVVGGVAGFFWWSATQREQTRQLVFVVPPGTVAKIANGEEVQVLPDLIEMSLDGQDTLIIRNDDTAEILVGPYKIAPGQQFRQQFFNPGTFELNCSVHKSDILRIVVRRSANENL